MKLVSLSGYTEGTDSPSARQFTLLYRAVYNNDREPVGDKQTVRRIVKLMDILDTAGEMVQNGQAVRLKATGAELLFEDTEFAQLQTMWDSFRGDLRSVYARDVAAVDALLEGAETVSTADLAKKAADKS